MIQHYMLGKEEAALRGEETPATVMDFDWGNMKNCDRVCFRCGHPQHIAQFCVANMPGDIKHCILSYSAQCRARWSQQ